jgi:hypothetical protein
VRFWEYDSAMEVESNSGHRRIAGAHHVDAIEVALSLGSDLVPLFRACIDLFGRNEGSQLGFALGQNRCVMGIGGEIRCFIAIAREIEQLRLWIYLKPPLRMAKTPVVEPIPWYSLNTVRAGRSPRASRAIEMPP